MELTYIKHAINIAIALHFWPFSAEVVMIPPYCGMHKDTHIKIYVHIYKEYSVMKEYFGTVWERCGEHAIGLKLDK